MTEIRTNAPIQSWQAGDAVSGFALLTRKETRLDRNGNAYLDLQLVDATGSIVGKVWSPSPALEGNFRASRFVAFEGTVLSHRGQLQLRVANCREATEEDRARGFDEALLVPVTRHGIGELWGRLEEILTDYVREPGLQGLVATALATHGAALREHPAAKSIHHAYRGGLLEHVVSMLELGLAISARYPELDRELLLVGVLFHDLGKIEELGVLPGSEYTRRGRLVGHVVIGRDLLLRCCAAVPDFPEELQLHLEHLVLAHQGRLEYGSPVEPKTAEAVALHCIDDLDAKLAQIREGRELGGGLQYLRGFGRYVYTELGPDTEDNDGSSEG